MSIAENIAGFFVLLFGFLVFIVGGIVLGNIINGYVLTKLWLWFIVPFFGFAPLSIPAAIGLSLIASYLTVQHLGLKAEDNNRAFWNACVMSLMRPFIVLLTGWIVHAYFMPSDIKPMFDLNKVSIEKTVDKP